jgi:outer membrane protein OmpA-like peptidoglycan-associated protein/tetratricopeptide (TPR) repeat protein
MNRFIKALIYFSLFLFSFSSSGQIKRADEYFNNLEYFKAVPFYEKALRKKLESAPAAHLAYCYKILKNYELAEIWYAKAVSFQDTDPINYFYYGQVLKNNNKPDEAKVQFETYVKKVPEDKVATTQINSCKEWKNWLQQTPKYSIKNETQLNSPEADFSPCYFSKGIAFVSDRGTVDLLGSDYNQSTNTDFLSVYYAAFKNNKGDSTSFKQIQKMPRNLNNNTHNGPISVSGDQKLMAFNRVDKKKHVASKHFTNHPKIYFATLSGETMGHTEDFPFNSDDYSVAHPALSPDGITVYFTSDMPGGFGGKDLYVSRKTGDSWSKPENLGPEINTSGDEEFPYIRKDGALFFSSDGHAGFGGMDIFSAVLRNGKWMDITNQGAPLNGPTDDFGIVFDDNISRGYFTSDRPGGKGNDDIYSFQVTNKFLRIAGKIMFSKDNSDPAQFATVSILTDEGQVLKVIKTDKNGFFQFENLPTDQWYAIKLDENDPVLKGKTRAYMTDEQGKTIRVTVVDVKGKSTKKFIYTNLPADPNAPPELLTADDMINLAGNILSGTNPAVPVANQVVFLKNEKGEVVQKTVTNAFGAFAFKDLPPDQNYAIVMDENDSPLATNTKITITNKSGKEIGTTVVGPKGSFRYRVISSDKNVMSAITVADVDLRVDLKGALFAGEGNKNAIANTNISIVDEKGNVVQKTRTDAKGNFQFTSLPSDQNYSVVVGEGNDLHLANLDKIFLTDANGKVVKEVKKNKTGGYHFDVLPEDQSLMGTVYVDDPWLKVLQLKQNAQNNMNGQKNGSITIIENIYYAFGDWKILPDAENILAKVVQVMKNDPGLMVEVDSHTDSRSSADFNMTLSNKRARTAVDYIVAHGIQSNRIRGVGFGETRLLNRCADGVECSDEEHAINRRTEFKITRNK